MCNCPVIVRPKNWDTLTWKARDGRWYYGMSPALCVNRDVLFYRMPLFRFEDQGLYNTPDGLVWAKGGYPG